MSAPLSGTPIPRATRRGITLMLVRTVATTALMLAVYYYAPLDRPIDVLSGIEFIVGLVALAGATVAQVRGILRSDTPRLRAMETVATGIPLFLLLFASAYVLLENAVPQSFTEPLTHTDGLYFTVTVFATVGFGDIVPRSELARVITMIQMLAGLISLGIVAKVLLGAVQLAVTRRENASTKGPGPADG
jgi:hypothetical protein